MMGKKAKMVWHLDRRVRIPGFGCTFQHIGEYDRRSDAVAHVQLVEGSKGVPAGWRIWRGYPSG